MLDIKFVRENPDVVKQNIKNKFQEHKLPLVDEVIALDKERRETQQKADDLRALRKKNSKMIGALMGQGKKEEAEAMKEEVAGYAKELSDLEAREAEIAEELKRSLGVEVDKRKIALDNDIKAFGTYECEVKLYNGITAKIYAMVSEQQ